MTNYFDNNPPRGLKDIIEAIIDGHITCGIDKEYCFVIDEDGYLVFLHRDDENSPHVKECNKYGEDRGSWPANSTDGRVVFKHETGTHRGTAITEQFLQILGIEYQG